MCTKHMGVRLIGVANKHRIWDARGPYQTIRGIMKQVFRRFRLTRCALYESLRCLYRSPDLAIFVLTTERQPLLRMRTRGVIILYIKISHIPRSCSQTLPYKTLYQTQTLPLHVTNFSQFDQSEATFEMSRSIIIYHLTIRI
jgi:hypothetical protein